jgi:hypothetical protein
VSLALSNVNHSVFVLYSIRQTINHESSSSSSSNPQPAPPTPAINLSVDTGEGQKQSSSFMFIPIQGPGLKKSLMQR